MNRVFALFVLLQLADFGTTVTVLALGGGEQNALVQHFMTLGPVQGVALAKLIALAIGALCLLAQKYRAIRVANVVYTGVAVWNATIIARLLA